VVQSQHSSDVVDVARGFASKSICGVEQRGGRRHCSAKSALFIDNLNSNVVALRIKARVAQNDSGRRSVTVNQDVSVRGGSELREDSGCRVAIWSPRATTRQNFRQASSAENGSAVRRMREAADD
jgi:hypothetical protein